MNSNHLLPTNMHIFGPDFHFSLFLQPLLNQTLFLLLLFQRIIVCLDLSMFINIVTRYFFLLILALWRYNLENFKFSHLKVYDSMYFNILTEFCNHHYIFQIVFIALKRNVVPLSSYPPQSRATTNLLSVSLYLLASQLFHFPFARSRIYSHSANKSCDISNLMQNIFLNCFSFPKGGGKVNSTYFFFFF